MIINPDMGRRMNNALRNMGEFTSIAEKISLERLIGFVDGVQENSAKGRFRDSAEPMILWGMRDKLKDRMGEIDNINLTNYFGAYINGYLFDAGVFKRFLDRIGKEKTKYSCALEHLEIPRIKEDKYFRTKDNIYNILDERGLLVYDNRYECYENGNRKNLEPQFRLKIKD